jgi:GNAT superfamily N-acetyltransferase
MAQVTSASDALEVGGRELCLLIAASVEIRPVDPEHPDARHCLAEYVAELNRRSTRGFDPSVGATALPQEVRPPAGQFFVAYLHREAIGCGAVKHHADSPAEIKRMWISPEAPGPGLGRLLLEKVEACALSGGARMAHIETSAVLTEALALYRSTGWVEVPRSTASRSRTTGSRSRWASGTDASPAAAFSK